MSDLSLKDLMVPVEDYASVPLGASILEGILETIGQAIAYFKEQHKQEPLSAIGIASSSTTTIATISRRTA